MTRSHGPHDLHEFAVSIGLANYIGAELLLFTDCRQEFAAELANAQMVSVCSTRVLRIAGPIIWKSRNRVGGGR